VNSSQNETSLRRAKNIFELTFPLRANHRMVKIRGYWAHSGGSEAFSANENQGVYSE
jgi:hypothetical protein